jgi:hypothetical protein
MICTSVYVDVQIADTCLCAGECAAPDCDDDFLGVSSQSAKG